MRLIQFVQFFAVLDRNEICMMFDRAAAITANVGAQFVDLIIPVLVKETAETLSTVKALPEKMSVLLVQVDCCKKSLISTEAICSENLPRIG